MKILMLNHNVVGRGTFHRCMAYARQLVARGHIVDVMTTSVGRRWRFATETRDGVGVVEAPDVMKGLARTGWDPWNTAMRMWHLRAAKYDIVHGFDGRPVVVYPAYSLQTRGIPFVSDWADWWGRGGIISQRRSFALRYLFAPIETHFEEHCRTLADHVTVISTALAERAFNLGVDKRRITRIPGGTEPDRIRPIAQASARRDMDIDASWRLITYSGFVQYDISFVVESFHLLAQQDPRVKLMLIGPRIDRLVSRLPLGIASRVWQVGVVESQDRLFKYLAASDVLLLPFLPTVANVGRWPNKASEYMCLGRPIITNAFGDVTEVVEAGAAVAVPAEPSSFALGIAQLLDDPDGREELGRRARWAAEAVFDYELSAPKLEAVYASAKTPGSLA